ncbi:MAG: ATP-binding protein, partial [Fibromonadales bacterium]|nr:ATP-binding protein [Fibromonadales bacterium]
LQKGMEIIGRCANADCVEIWQNEMRDGELYAVIKCYWVNEELQLKNAGATHSFPYSTTPEWESRLLRGERIHGPVSSLSQGDQGFLEPYGVKSILAIPIIIENRLWGMCCIDDYTKSRDFAEEEINILHSATLMMVNAINRNEQAAKIQKMMRATEYKSNLLYAVNYAATFLLNSNIDSFESDLHQSMKIMTEAVKADRMYIWKNYMVDGQLYCTQIYEQSEAVEPQQGKKLTHSIPYKDKLLGWEMKLSKGECINNLVRNMPQGEQDMLVPQGILSVLIVPVFIKEQFWGFVGFDDCHNERLFTEEEESILRSSALLLANALLRNEMIVNIRDTSIKLESALVQANAANKAKSELLATISHEIRTPMNAILGITEIQLQNEDISQNARESLNIIYNSGDSLLRIINDLLDLSKIEAKKLEIIPAKYEIASLINDTAQLNMTRIESKPIEFRLNVDENIPSLLFGDELRIKQILNNILSNAFKYTDRGEVSMSVSMEKSNGEDFDITLVFRISDTGHGMAKEQVRKIFDEYSRFNLTRNNEIEGTGLGMSITQGLVSLMKGEIFVESELGKGSEFMVRLPQKSAGSNILGKEISENLQKFHISNASEMEKIKIVRDPMPYGKVLIVDDVESNLYVAKHLLDPYDLSVELATSGFEAIDKIKSGKVYDIIFMDHMMPKMDGIEAVKIIRNLGYSHPIVALTANAVVGQAETFLENGFNGFIFKPINTILLNAELNKFIRDKQLPKTLAEFKPDSTLRSIFAKDAKSTLPVFESALKNIKSISNDDLDLFAVKAHAMKSALANIEENELSQIAFALEKAGKERDKNIIEAQTQKFIDALQAIINKIEAETKATAVCDEDAGYLKEQLKIIGEACANYDAQTANAALANLNKMPWTCETKALLDRINENLLHSNFEEIATEIAHS